MEWDQARALDAIAAFVLRESKLPVRGDWGNANDLPSRETIARLFGSERAAITALVIRALKS